MKVTDQDVTYVASLANLELTEEEHRRMVKDLDSILAYIDRLNELDTTDVPPMAQVFAESGQGDSRRAIAAAWRDDSPRPPLPHDEAMKNAPDTDGQFFRVPKVIER
jgi:aspartyl-tRNA(Asn)/glutamyl-tRNA(Gln) amidotransferase subunit C